MFRRTPLDRKKIPLLSIKVHLTLDVIGYLLYDSMYQQNVGAAAPGPGVSVQIMLKGPNAAASRLLLASLKF